MISGSELGAKLCEALGLDPKATVELSLKCVIGEPVYIRVRQFVVQDGEVTNLFKNYRIEEV